MLECRNKKTPVMVTNIQRDFIFILSSYYVAKMFQARGRISPTFFSLSFFLTISGPRLALYFFQRKNEKLATFLKVDIDIIITRATRSHL